MSKDELDRIRAVYTARQEIRTADRYRGDAPAEVHALARRREMFRALLGRWLPEGLSGQTILDVGCGRGSRLAEWSDWGAEPSKLVGVDLMPSLIGNAKKSFPKSSWLVGSGDRLPFKNQHFDVVTQSMAVSSILKTDMRASFAAEMWRVLKPGGVLLWYDFHYPNPFNPNVLPVRRGELNSLFPMPPKEVCKVTLIPPLARLIAPRAPGLVRYLECLPFLRSHHVALFKKEC